MVASIDFSKCYGSCLKEGLHDGPGIPFLSPFKDPSIYDGHINKYNLYYIHVLRKYDVFTNDIQPIFGFQLLYLQEWEVDEGYEPLRFEVLWQLEVKWTSGDAVVQFIDELFESVDEKCDTKEDGKESVGSALPKERTIGSMCPEFKKQVMNWGIGCLWGKYNKSRSAPVGPFKNYDDALDYRDANDCFIQTYYKPIKKDLCTEDIVFYHSKPQQREVSFYLCQPRQKKTEIIDGHRLIRLMVICQSQVKNHMLAMIGLRLGLDKKICLKTDDTRFLMPRGMTELPREFTSKVGESLGEYKINILDTGRGKAVKLLKDNGQEELNDTTQCEKKRIIPRKAVHINRHTKSFFVDYMKEMGVTYQPSPTIWDELDRELSYDLAHCSEVKVLKQHNQSVMYSIPLHYSPKTHCKQ